MNKTQLASYIDHTLLKPATVSQMEKLCAEAKQFGFASVCVLPDYVSLCARLLAGSNVKVCTVVGFPLGENVTSVKTFETSRALGDGAEEIDMVINLSWAKQNDWEKVEKEISAVREACAEKTLKVIIETCQLDDKQIVSACMAAVNAKADFVKTSTGFSTGGATTHAVALMSQTVSPFGLKVKASGGIHTFDEAVSFVEVGASRIGASAGVAICSD